MAAREGTRFGTTYNECPEYVAGRLAGRGPTEFDVAHFSSRGIPRLVVGLAAAAFVTWSACGRRAPEVAGVPEVVDFNFHVKPILSDRCFKCHGPDEQARKASLRLDRKDAAFGELP